jgi:RNA polymerase sigma factor (sigma-70 family)
MRATPCPVAGIEPFGPGGGLTVRGGGTSMLPNIKEPDGRSSVTESDEARLVGLVAEGDLRAFETLYRGYFPRLTRFLDRMTRRPQLIGEIIDDTMLVVWQKAHTYNLASKVSTWIFAIAYRKALKALQAVDDPLECDFEHCAGEDGCSPEDAAVLHQSQEMLSRALGALAVEQRAVVSLTFYHGLGYGEIAEIMDCPVNTVKSRMYHARRHLKTLLSGTRP